jgi:DNA-binding NtrC family response regulator
VSVILLVDDEPDVILGQKSLLQLSGYSDLREAHSVEEARAVLGREEIDLILLDLTLQEGSGQELLAEVTASHPSTVVVVVTGAADVGTAVDCMQLGAHNFLIKGSDSSRLPAAVRSALQHQRTLHENRLLREAVTRHEPEAPESFEGFITRDPRVLRVLVYLEALASLPDPILITGETGVGKELIAHGVHRASGRSGAFVPVNMAGVDDLVFTDTLFGHKRGSFTGAERPRDGLVTMAAEGTLFLDEIGDMPHESQARLLRLLDSGEFLRLGSDRPEYSRARLVFATNRDLASAVSAGQFRRDLYYRISTHHVHIPPLRERPEDIGAILSHLMAEHSERTGFDAVPVSEAVTRKLQGLPLEGNVRELEQMVLRSIVGQRWSFEVDGDLLSLVPLTDEERHATRPVPDPPASQAAEAADESAGTVRFGETLPSPDDLLRLLLEEADRRHPESRTAAAAEIGLSPQAFANRWKRAVSDRRDDTPAAGG